MAGVRNHIQGVMPGTSPQRLSQSSERASCWEEECPSRSMRLWANGCRGKKASLPASASVRGPGRSARESCDTGGYENISAELPEMTLNELAPGSLG